MPVEQGQRNDSSDRGLRTCDARAGRCADEAGILNRRRFGTLLAGSLGGLAIPGTVSAAGPYGTFEGICDTLLEIKEQVCGIADIVAGDPGPLSDPEQIAAVTQAVFCAATLGQKLISDPDSLLFTPPNAWLFWQPVFSGAWNLTETSTEACDRACDQYELWCAGETQNVAEGVWQAQHLLCRIFLTAGIS